MKFSKPPSLKNILSAIEKEKKADEFLNFMPSNRQTINLGNQNLQNLKDNVVTQRIFKKEETKPFVLRLPKSLALDLAEISALSNISINATCIEMLRNTSKQKLKELKE